MFYPCNVYINISKPRLLQSIDYLPKQTDRCGAGHFPNDIHHIHVAVFCTHSFTQKTVRPWLNVK